MAQKPKKPQATFPVRLLKKYRPADGGAALPAGSEAELPIDEAKGLIAAKIAERNDPIPEGGADAGGEGGEGDEGNA